MYERYQIIKMIFRQVKPPSCAGSTSAFPRETVPINMLSLQLYIFHQLLPHCLSL